MKLKDSLFAKFLNLYKKYKFQTDFELNVYDIKKNVYLNKKKYDHRVYNGYIVYDYIRENISNVKFIPVLNSLKYSFKDRLVNYFKQLFRFFTVKSLFKYDFKYNNEDNVINYETRPHLYLSVDETKQILKKSKKVDVPFHVMLLNIINDFLSESLLTKNKYEMVSLLPIAIKDNLDPKELNFGFYEVRQKGLDNPNEIRDDLEDSMSSQSYLRLNYEMFFITIMNKLFPKWTKNKISKDIKEGYCRFSIMTFFGQGSTTDKNKIPVGRNIVSSFYPTHIACGIINRRLLLNISILDRYVESENRVIELHLLLKKKLMEICDG